ncbi:MAG: hypothetical protein PHQ95_00555 [Candidatus Gracilibacteria bacterium]|nr:hypothetical protein [Candidatus Gracilibacteria bacterium]
MNLEIPSAGLSLKVSTLTEKLGSLIETVKRLTVQVLNCQTIPPDTRNSDKVFYGLPVVTGADNDRRWEKLKNHKFSKEK